jgi:septum site-determining protein MinD
VTRIVVVTSGKGGVGKTTTSASFATGLALRGFKTAVIDFDVGLRNLDLIMGCERRVVYDFVNVINGEATLTQALIKDKHCDNLFVLPASQTRDKDALTEEGVEKVLKELNTMGFDYIVCDSPAGIESGAVMALTFADEALVVTNPEVSSVRDSDRILGILQAKSRRAIEGPRAGQGAPADHPLQPERVEEGEMLSYKDIQEILRVPLIGVIPESEEVLQASNQGAGHPPEGYRRRRGLPRRRRPLPRRRQAAALRRLRQAGPVEAPVRRQVTCPGSRNCSATRQKPPRSPRSACN